MSSSEPLTSPPLPDSPGDSSSSESTRYLKLFHFFDFLGILSIFSEFLPGKKCFPALRCVEPKQTMLKKYSVAEIYPVIYFFSIVCLDHTSEDEDCSDSDEEESPGESGSGGEVSGSEDDMMLGLTDETLMRFKRLDLRFLEIGVLRVIFTKRDPQFPGISGQVV
eukprot:sb/3472525/